MDRPLKFRLHFNRINVARKDPHIWTVHTSRQCIPARTVDVRVPLQTVYKGPEARQPRAYMSGKGVVTTGRNGHVTIS